MPPALTQPQAAYTHPAGGSFMRLEQDWRETHLAYLQHTRLAMPAGAGGSNLLSAAAGGASGGGGSTRFQGLVRVASSTNLRPGSALAAGRASSRMRIGR